jgi:Domain of unknown function (DUF4253)
MPDVGRAWLAVSGAHAETGLVPVLLAEARPGAREAGMLPDFGFFWPAEVDLLDQMSAQDVLAAGWGEGADDEDDDVLAEARAPFGRRFPGLAPPSYSRLSPAEMGQALASLAPAYLGVAAAGRPADLPAVVGWSVFGSDGIGLDARSLAVATVLRSWEERFGARLLRIGSDAKLKVLVERPPRTLEAAWPIAAEHWALADECCGSGLRDVPAIAASLVNAPIWTFWWD